MGRSKVSEKGSPDTGDSTEETGTETYDEAIPDVLENLDSERERIDEKMRNYKKFCDKKDLEGVLESLKGITSSLLMTREEVVLWLGKEAQDQLSADILKAAAKFVPWHKDLYTTFFGEILLNEIRNSSTDVYQSSIKVQSLQCAMIYVRFESENAGGVVADHFSKIINAILEQGVELLSIFAEEYLRYIDIRTRLFVDLESRLESKATSNAVVRNIFHLLRKSTEIIDEESKDLKPDDSRVCYVKAEEVRQQKLYQSQMQHFGGVWEALVAKDLPDDVRYAILLVIDRAIPHMKRPERIFAFLDARFRVKGVEGLLAASSLFMIMMEGNLEFPDFYEQLYEHLDTDILYSKHRTKFIELANKFMSSTHIPAYVSASYIKRLGRISLFAPAPGIIIVIELVLSLLQREPACESLVNRKKRKFTFSSAPHDDSYSEAESSEAKFKGKEVFDNRTHDLSATHALESSFWEGITLKSHYAPAVAKLAKAFENPEKIFSGKLVPFSLDTLSAMSYRSLIETEMRKKRKPTISATMRKSISYEGDGFEGWKF